MPELDIADETFVVADPARVAGIVADPASWRAWWPDLTLVVTRDRGVKGVQWSCSGEVEGTMEVWLEPHGDGVIVHYYLRASLTGRGRPERVRDRRNRDWKRHVHALKDRLEAGREPGHPRAVAEPARAAEPAPAVVDEPAVVKEPSRPADAP